MSGGIWRWGKGSRVNCRTINKKLLSLSILVTTSHRHNKYKQILKPINYNDQIKTTQSNKGQKPQHIRRKFNPNRESKLPNLRKIQKIKIPKKYART